MSAPQGFNPAVSLIPPNPSAPIVPFQGGGGSIQPFYQAIIAGLPEEKRKDLPKQIQILNFTISVEDGKFILKLRVKGKQGTEEEEEDENENEDENEDEDENEIIKKAKEFLILEAARNWLRNVSTITLNNLGDELNLGQEKPPGPTQQDYNNLGEELNLGQEKPPGPTQQDYNNLGEELNLGQEKPPTLSTPPTSQKPPTSSTSSNPPQNPPLQQIPSTLNKNFWQRTRLHVTFQNATDTMNAARRLLQKEEKNSRKKFQVGLIQRRPRTQITAANL